MNAPCISLIRTAIKEAEKSDYRIRMGAVIFNKKKIVSKGHNHTNSLQRKLHPTFQEWPDSIHAEVEAVLKAKQNLKGYDLLIIRINKKKQFRISKPCPHCTALLNHVGIRNVYFSNDDGMIEKMKL
jgi:tRNA(Arg) A34 adenosine deaminase TadA